MVNIWFIEQWKISSAIILSLYVTYNFLISAVIDILIRYKRIIRKYNKNGRAFSLEAS